MISFLREIVDTAGLPVSELNGVVTYSGIGGNAIMINNYVKILSYSNSRIVFQIKNDEMVVDGFDLSIREMNKRDICVSGDIVRVYFVSKVKRYEKAE